MNHDELRAKAMRRPAVRRAYESMRLEYALLERMLAARRRASLSQAEVARRMGTKPPAVVRLERSLTTGAHSPSLATLRKYAYAVNCELDIKLLAHG